MSEGDKSVRPLSLSLASTIGPIDAGIVPALLEAYRARTGVTVALTGAGTGKTLELARGGGFDVVIVHAKALEEQFIAGGYGLSRHELMANDFVVVGPADDPAGVGTLTDAVDAFRRIAEQGAPFLTRGDLSGTHVKELDVWEAATLTPSGENAARFVAWLLGDEAQQLISDFGVQQFGQPLFFPRAPGWSRTPTALVKEFS